MPDLILISFLVCVATWVLIFLMLKEIPGMIREVRRLKEEGWL